MPPEGSVYGAPLRPGDLRRLARDPLAFTRLCSALTGFKCGEIWSKLGQAAGTMIPPGATGRITVPDGGLDAWVAMPPGIPETGDLLGPGRTGFQFKCPEVSVVHDRSKLSKYRAKLAEEIKNVAAVKGDWRVDRYVVMLCDDWGPPSGSKAQSLLDALRKAACAVGRDDLKCLVFAEHQIIDLLVQYTAVRYAFEPGGVWMTVAAALEENRIRSGEPAGWKFHGRQDELKQIRSFLADPMARSMTVSGPTGAGKSRTVIEALCDGDNPYAVPDTESAPLDCRVVWSTTPSLVNTTDLRRLNNGAPIGVGRTAAIVVVDPCDDSDLTRLRDATSGFANLKTILISSSETAPEAGGFYDLSIGEMGSDPWNALLNQAAKQGRLSFADRRLVESRARKLPGRIHSLVNVLMESDSGKREKAFEQIQSAWVARLLLRLGQPETATLELLALLPSWSNEDQIDTVQRSLGSASDWRIGLDGLIKLGVVKRVQATVAVEGEVALVLCRRVYGRFVGREGTTQLLSAFRRTDAWPAFVKRLCDVGAVSNGLAEPLLAGIVAETGPLSTPEGMVDYGALLCDLARVASLRADLSRLMRRAVETPEGRRTVAPSSFSYGSSPFVRALDRLLTDPASCQDAGRAAFALACDETSVGHGTATELLGRFLSPMDALIRVALEQRLDIFDRLASDADAKGIVVLSVSLELALNPETCHGFSVHEGEPFPPFVEPSHVPRESYNEALRSYIKAMVRYLAKWIDEAEPSAARIARKAYVARAADFAWPVGLGEVIATLERHASDVRDVSLARGAFLQIEWIADRAACWLEPNELKKNQPDFVPELRKGLTQARTAIERLNGGNAAVELRLRRWTTNSDVHAQFEPTTQIGRRYWHGRDELECDAIAAEITDPVALSGLMDSWLLTEHATQRMTFFWVLGERDSDLKFLDVLVNRLDNSFAADAIRAYATARGVSLASDAQRLLDRLPDVDALALTRFELLRYAPHGSENLRRLIDLVRSKRIKPTIAAQYIRSGPWLTQLASEDFGLLCDLYADLERSAVRAFGGVAFSWLHANPNVPPPIGLDRLLEQASPKTGGLDVSSEDDDRGRDDLWGHAAELFARVAPDRGLDIARRVFGVAESDAPSIYQFRRFWKHAVGVLVGVLPTEVLEMLVGPLNAADAPWFSGPAFGHEWLDLKRHAGQVAGFVRSALTARPSESAAVLRFVAGLSADDDGFWSLAAKLLHSEEAADRLDEALLTAATRRPTVYSGPLEEHQERRRRAAHVALSGNDSRTANFVRRLDLALKHGLGAAVMWDYDFSSADARALLESRLPEHRERQIWLIHRLLTRMPSAEVKRYLSDDQIREALTDLGDELDPLIRRRWQAIVGGTQDG